MPVIVWGLSFLIFHLSMLHVAEAQTNPKPIVIASSWGLDTLTGKWLHMTYTEAFRRLNLPFEYKVYPSKRVTLMLKEGKG